MDFNSLPIKKAMMWSYTLGYWFVNTGCTDGIEYVKEDDKTIFCREVKYGNFSAWRKFDVPTSKLIDTDWK